MLQFLLNHCVSIVGLLALVILARNLTKEYMGKKGLDRAQLVSLLRLKTNEVGKFLFPKIIASVVITLTISPISFREIWVPDVYHVVFITSILFNRVEQYLAKLLDRPSILP